MGFGDGVGVGEEFGVGVGDFLDDGSSLIAEYEVGGVVVPRTLQFAAQTLATGRGFLVALWRLNN